MPACFSMLLSVPIGISRTGCGTVTRPGFTGCLNCLWLPTWATSYQPSCFKPCMTSRLDIRHDTHFLHTRQVGAHCPGCIQENWLVPAAEKVGLSRIGFVTATLFATRVRRRGVDLKVQQELLRRRYSDDDEHLHACGPRRFERSKQQSGSFGAASAGSVSSMLP
jgi:hypothetical protein